MRSISKLTGPLSLLAVILAVSSLGCESPRDAANKATTKASVPAAASPGDSVASTESTAATQGASNWREPITVATGDAFAGPWRMNDSRFFYVDDPTVAVTDSGGYAVAWVDNRRQDVFFQRYDADGNPQLDKPSNVSKSRKIFSWLPRMVVSSPNADEVYVLWQEIVFSGGSHGGEAFFARSTDGGETFEQPINLSNSKAGDGKGRLTEERWDNGSLDIARGPDGELFAAWTEYEGTLWMSRSDDNGRTFSTPAKVGGTNDEPARGPSLAVSDDGTVHLAWTVGEDAGADIRVATSTDGGRSFDAPAVAVATDGHSDAPKIAVDSDGTTHLVFAESPTGMFGHYHVRYARADEPADGFSETRALSGPHSTEDPQAHFPALAIDGSDRIYVTWEFEPPNADRARGLGYTASIDGGDSFADPTLVPGTDQTGLGFNGSLQGGLMRKLDANASGDLGIVNSRFDPGESSRVRLLRAPSED